MNTRERHIVRQLLRTTDRLPVDLAPADAVTVAHATRDILQQLADAEQPFTKEYKCHDQAEAVARHLDQYVTRREQENWMLSR